MLVIAAAAGFSEAASRSGQNPIRFSDARRQAADFIRYDQTIQLTAEQNKILETALSSMPAPCCDRYSMATCCCPCNLARGVWGLSKVLITRYRQDAKQVEAAARAWLEFINPDGYSGKACFAGGCLRPFEKDGCGGMDANHVS
jgi:hypothetical protein